MKVPPDKVVDWVEHSDALETLPYAFLEYFNTFRRRTAYLKSSRALARSRLWAMAL